ncbi:hypothetical protein ACJX0J_032815 [Zea mays]
MYLVGVIRSDIFFMIVISNVNVINAMTGYAITHGGANLTTLDIATIEGKWMREFLMELPILEKPHSDNLYKLVKEDAILLTVPRASKIALGLARKIAHAALASPFWVVWYFLFTGLFPV